MDKAGEIHSKKISAQSIMRSEQEFSAARVARAMTQKTHVPENYCSAPRVFAETSRFSPGI
jgi:hypothetical protein